MRESAREPVVLLVAMPLSVAIYFALVWVAARLLGDVAAWTVALFGF